MNGRTHFFSTIAALAFAGAAATPALSAGETVKGDYAEARSAAVYAGACHYNGEVMTQGREAVMAWKVREGQVNGIRVDGLSVVAVVAGGANLAEAGAARRSVLYVDAKATPEQRDALVNLLKAKAGAALGNVAAVQSAPVVFDASKEQVKVSAGNAANLNLSRYPCEHCRMPSQVWYKPLAPSKDAAVAQGIATGFSDKTLGVSWSSASVDNAFVGTFAL